jgi:hypothetical protein
MVAIVDDAEGCALLAKSGAVEGKVAKGFVAVVRVWTQAVTDGCERGAEVVALGDPSRAHARAGARVVDAHR